MAWVLGYIETIFFIQTFFIFNNKCQSTENHQDADLDADPDAVLLANRDADPDAVLLADQDAVLPADQDADLDADPDAVLLAVQDANLDGAEE